MIYVYSFCLSVLMLEVLISNFSIVRTISCLLGLNNYYAAESVLSIRHNTVTSLSLELMCVQEFSEQRFFAFISSCAD